VLDADGMFEQRCNLAMVDLEPIADEDDALENTAHQGGDLEAHGLVDIMHDLSRYDDQRLRMLIEKHHQLTGSARAVTILEDWEGYRSRFVKVMPVEYRKALQKMQEQANEADNSSASMAAGV